MLAMPEAIQNRDGRGSLSSKVRTGCFELLLSMPRSGAILAMREAVI